MSQQFMVQAREDHVYVEFSGALTFDMAKHIVERLFTTFRQHGLSKVLVDARGITGEVPISLRLEMADFIISTQPAPITLAVAAPAHVLEGGSVFETLMDNRGGIVKVTTSLDEAREWLQSKKTQPLPDPPQGS